MNKDTMLSLQVQLDEIVQVIPETKLEFWFARDLMLPLGYQRWENFISIIQKAITACETTGDSPDDHFRGVTKMVATGIEWMQCDNENCKLCRQNCKLSHPYAS